MLLITGSGAKNTSAKLLCCGHNYVKYLISTCWYFQRLQFHTEFLRNVYLLPSAVSLSYNYQFQNILHSSHVLIFRYRRELPLQF